MALPREQNRYTDIPQPVLDVLQVRGDEFLASLPNPNSLYEKAHRTDTLLITFEEAALFTREYSILFPRFKPAVEGILLDLKDRYTNTCSLYHDTDTANHIRWQYINHLLRTDRHTEAFEALENEPEKDNDTILELISFAFASGNTPLPPDLKDALVKSPTYYQQYLCERIKQKHYLGNEKEIKWLQLEIHYWYSTIPEKARERNQQRYHKDYTRMLHDISYNTCWSNKDDPIQHAYAFLETIEDPVLRVEYHYRLVCDLLHLPGIRPTFAKEKVSDLLQTLHRTTNYGALVGINSTDGKESVNVVTYTDGITLNKAINMRSNVLKMLIDRKELYKTLPLVLYTTSEIPHPDYSDMLLLLPTYYSYEWGEFFAYIYELQGKESLDIYYELAKQQYPDSRDEIDETYILCISAQQAIEALILIQHIPNEARRYQLFTKLLLPLYKQSQNFPRILVDIAEIARFERTFIIEQELHERISDSSVWEDNNFQKDSSFTFIPELPRALVDLFVASLQQGDITAATTILADSRYPLWMIPHTTNLLAKWKRTGRLAA